MMWSEINKRILSKETQKMKDFLTHGYNKLNFSSDDCPVLLGVREERCEEAFQDLLFDHFESNKFAGKENGRRRGGGFLQGGTRRVSDAASLSVNEK
jgi:hypothetical protein